MNPLATKYFSDITAHVNESPLLENVYQQFLAWDKKNILVSQSKMYWEIKNVLDTIFKEGIVSGVRRTL